MILVSQLYDHTIVYMSQIFFNIKELASWSYHQGFAHWAKSPRQINAQSIDCHGWPIVGEIWLLDRLTFCILQFFSTTFAYDSNNIYSLSLSLSYLGVLIQDCNTWPLETHRCAQLTGQEVHLQQVPTDLQRHLPMLARWPPQ